MDDEARASDSFPTTFDRDERWRSISGCGARGERRPLAVLRWCNAIACHFFYALCFSLRVSRRTRRLAKSRRTCLFHARTFAPSASPRPPVHAESRLRVSHNARRGDGTEGHETHTPRARARARVLRGDVRAPPPAALTERQQQQSRGYVLGLILLILFLSSRDFSPPLAAPGGGRAGRARGSRAAQGGRQGSTDRGPLRVQRAAGAGEPAPEGGGDRARGLAAKFGETRDGGCVQPHRRRRVLRRRRASVLGTASARKASSADGDDPRDSADAAHVDEGMRLREAMKKVDGDETEGETETTRKNKKSERGETRSRSSR